MSESPSGDLHETPSAEDPGILAGLPRTRPQRASARRAAARAATARDARRAPTHSPARKAPPTHGDATRPPARKAPPTHGDATRPPARKAPRKAPRSAASGSERAGASVPPQGYEPEDGALSRTIQPPGGAELIVSVAELAGELAKAGVNTGGRLLRDVFSRLPSG